FILATALRDGSLTLNSFTDSNIHDLQQRGLMQRITIKHNAAFTERFPEELVSRLEVTTQSGQRFVFDSTYPKGHVRNPATHSEVDAKFDTLADGVVSPEQRDTIRAAVARIDECRDASALVDTLVWASA